MDTRLVTTPRTRLVTTPGTRLVTAPGTRLGETQTERERDSLGVLSATACQAKT